MMNLSEEKAIQIAENYQKDFPELIDAIKKARFNSQFDVIGKKAWIAIGEFELFGEIREIFYVISDETEKVEYIFDEYGNRNFHLPDPNEHWDQFTDEDIERMNNGEWDDKWDEEEIN